MFKAVKEFLCVIPLLCASLLVQASDVIEILDLRVPSESGFANLLIACANSEKFVECGCFYDNETHRLTKVVMKSNRICETEFRKESRKMLSWVAEHLIPNPDGESVRADYGELRASNSWGEVAFVKACGNGLSVTVEHIATAERLRQSGSASVSFPEDFMGFGLSSRMNETNLLKAVMSISEGADRGGYEYYVWNIPSVGDRQSFFDNGSCELSLKSKGVMAIRLNKRFQAGDRTRIAGTCRKILIENCGVVGIRDVVNPITGEEIGGASGVDGRGIRADFRIEQDGSSSGLLLTARFQLPRNAYGKLLAEGACGAVDKKVGDIDRFQQTVR